LFLSALDGVTAVSANDVWAVGDSSLANGAFQTLIEHWNGHTWKVVKSPNVPSEDNELLAVAAVSTNDVWAVRDSHTTSGAFQTLTQHWDGHKWSVNPSPNPGAQFNQLFCVAAPPQQPSTPLPGE
jgi:hypothetical protein